MSLGDGFRDSKRVMSTLPLGNSVAVCKYLCAVMLPMVAPRLGPGHRSRSRRHFSFTDSRRHMGVLSDERW